MNVKRARITDHNAAEWREVCHKVVKNAYDVLGNIPNDEFFIGSMISYLEDIEGVFSFFVTCPGQLVLKGTAFPFIYLGLSGTIYGERSKGKRTACVEDTFSYLREHHTGQYGIAICGTSPTLRLAEMVSTRVIPSNEPTNQEVAIIKEFGQQFLNCEATKKDLLMF